jgi:glycine betaine/choline ABC-type transport system substrate-binding protein
MELIGVQKMFKKIIITIVAAISCLTACTKSQRKIVIASKPHSEQYILAEMIAKLIEKHSDIKVERKLGIGGGTSNIHPAMISGEIDIYPEYTGTAWLFVLKEKTNLSPIDIYKGVKEQYHEKFKITWFNIYGFNNTYSLAIKPALAKQYKIKTYSDLAKHADKFIFGAEYDFFEREDGYSGLQKVYGINFKTNKELDIGLKYEAISSGKVDIINSFSTDGLLRKYKLKVLKDNKNFFPAYQAATLIREDTLKKYPELVNILKKLEGQINNIEMITLNYLVESEKKDPKVIAEDFLYKKGLL